MDDDSEAFWFYHYHLASASNYSKYGWMWNCTIAIAKVLSCHVLLSMDMHVGVYIVNNSSQH